MTKEYCDAMYFHSSYMGTYLQPCLILSKSPYCAVSTTGLCFILFFDPILEDYTCRWVTLDDLTEFKPDYTQ